MASIGVERPFTLAYTDDASKSDNNVRKAAAKAVQVLTCEHVDAFVRAAESKKGCLLFVRKGKVSGAGAHAYACSAHLTQP